VPVPLVPTVRLHRLPGPLEHHWELLGSLPYWAHPWPGGQALARFVLDHPDLVAGRRVLDLASGSGLVAVAAALAGAREVTAADVDPAACRAVLRNAAGNGVTVLVEARDVLDDAPAGHDVVLAGDACYESDLARRLTDYLRRAASAGALALLGDPGRTYCDRHHLVHRARYAVPTPEGVERADVTPTDVWEGAAAATSDRSG
jgi:predicted nicotinamide N-methyase